MNVLKKLVQQQTTSSASSAPVNQTNTTGARNPAANSQDYALHLQHLKKVFESISRTPSGSSVNAAQDDRLYQLVPIFVKLFKNASVEQIQMQFPDLLLFGTALAKLLVHEIKKRAGDRSSEGAGIAIAEFLSPSDFSHGWLLLVSLQTLSPCSGRLADMICGTSLPSTIVKSLYLFFDLPPVEGDLAVQRQNLAAICSEILCNLLRNAVGAEELAKKDDLSLLFIAATSPCPVANSIWRTCCQDALCVLSRHALTAPVLGYIHSKGCLKICVDNMRNVHQLSVEEIFCFFQYIAVFLQQAFDRSQTMVDDFRVAQGFAFIVEFGLRLAEEPPGTNHTTEHFIAIVKELCVHGPAELRVQLSQSPFRLVSFQMPKPKGPPFSIRCVDVFQCLQDLFLKTQSQEEAKCILLATNELFVWDEANYFVMDALLNTLSLFTTKVALLTPDVQNIYFNLLRHIVIELNHVPCKELASLALALRNVPLHSAFFKSALVTLKRILFHDVTFQDVYRDVGLMEVLTQKFMSAEKFADFPPDLMDVFQSMLKQNNQNCPLFREAGGSQHLLHLINTVELTGERTVLLMVLQHLLTSVGCDDDMQHLLTSFNSTLNGLEIKQDLLRCLCSGLRESHRSRIAFRKSGAFVSLVSAIVALEGKFETFDSAVYSYLSCIFETLTTAMRYEPSNAKHFQTEIRWTALTDALRLLGCFDLAKILAPWSTAITDSEAGRDSEVSSLIYSRAFFKPDSVVTGASAGYSACLVFRCLYLMALDGYRHGWADNFEMLLSDAPIVHAGAVLVMLDLLPATPVESEDSPALVVFVADVLKSLVRHERNQQLMCEAGMVNELLNVCEAPLADESHPLSSSIQYILERLAAQSLRPKELRTLLRLRFHGHLPLSRIKTLVSMITLRDFQSVSPPAFVEFDLSYEGFGGLFMPSLAPQSVSSFAIHGSLGASESATVLGGIGSGLRVFPPTGGFSVVMWFCIDCFAPAESIRLIDITRHMAAKPTDSLTCLSIHVVMDGNMQPKLVVSTREHAAPESPDMEASGDTVILDMAVLREQEAMWHCLTVSLGKTLVKSGYCNVYLDSKNLGQFKLTYIPQNPGGGAAHLATASSVSATVGTQPIHRKPCKLRWRLANTFILEDALNLSQVQLLYNLGPAYHGNFQDPQCSSLNLSDDKVLFGLNPVIATEMSVSKIRRIYNKDDAKFIAKHLSLSSHDSSTPVKIIHNSAAHLRGASRGIGSAVVGYLGVRLFSPKPAHQALLPIGGVWSLLGMVAMAPDTEYLYAAMKCLFCALRTNSFLREQMTSCGGYQFVAMMLKKKKDVLNAHVLHLAFSMIATGETSKEGSVLYDRNPIENLLSDIQLWQACSSDLQRSVFEHFIELSKEHNSNAKMLCETGLIRKVFQFLLITASTDSLENSVLYACGDLLKVLLRSSGKSSSDVLSFAQYMICTIPTSAELKITSNVTIRAIGLQTIRSLVETFPDLLATFLGFDWLLSFLHPALHSQSIMTVLDILCDLLLKNPNNLLFFREARNVGAWLRDSTPSRRRNDALRLIPSHQSSLQVNLDVVTVSGFFALQLLLPELQRLSVTWMSMLSLFLGHRLVQDLRIVDYQTNPESPVTLDTVWLCLFSTSPGMPIKLKDYHIVCPEAVYVILSMVRACVEQGGSENANCILQVLIYMYHNWSEFGQLALTADFLTALATGLFTTNDEDPQVIVRLSNTRRLVLDLLRMIITDSMALPAERATVITDAWMEAFPEAAKPATVVAYQTEICDFMVDHIMAINAVVDTSGMWIHPVGHRNYVCTNIFSLAQRFVDRVWKNSLLKSELKILEFVIHILTSSIKNGGSLPGTDAGFYAVNRLVIYLITRPAESVSAQMAVLDALHKLVDHRAIIFHPINNDQTFLGALAYCLALLVDRVPISCDVSAQSTWHTYSEMSGPVQEGWQLILSAACNVWNILVQAKTRELKELLRPPPAVLDGDLAEVKDFLRESCQKIWLTFLTESGAGGAEKRTTGGGSASSGSGMNMASVKKLPHSLVRAYSRTKSTKQLVTADQKRVPPALFLHQVRLHCLLVNQYVQDQLSHLQRGLTSLNRLVEDEWGQCESEFLLRERSLWGQEEPWKLAKWMLDLSEGPQRVRKKLVENVDFFLHYAWRDLPQPPPEAGVEAQKQRIRYPVSLDSKVFFEEELEGGLVKTLLQATKGGNSLNSLLPASLSNEDLSEPTEMTDVDTTTEEEDEEESDDTVIRRLMEEGDTITYAFRCARVEGLDAYEGLMLLGKEHFYLIDGFTLLSTREIRDIESIPPGQREPVLPSVIVGKRRRQKFHYDEIREVMRRRYLLQPIGLEIVCSSGRTNFLAFPRDISSRVMTRLLAISPNITDSAYQSVAGQKRSAQVEPQSGLLNSIIGETSVTQRWVRGEISNFQYLMFLNTLSGRSYNDLMQYPVFPWILADYDSETLDLTNPETFRDLSKPMGAQTPDRLESYTKRYREWDPHTKDTPFFYGTHYSTAMIVASYLLRLEPFTQYFLHLQGGHFDLADRMFHSIKDAWWSAAKNNMADVKELIPEFFYLPDFLNNANKFDLGIKQSGVQLNDVILPPWSRGDAREFIRVHRAALECDFVSQHLHEWIDLVFGAKQLGQAAVDAMNLFHGWMYEGAVDLEKMTDPLEKQAFIAFINNFGQVPSQIFKKPHPLKKVSNNRPEFLFHNLGRLQPIVLTGKELRSPVGNIISLDRNCIPLEQNKAPIAPLFQKYLAWGFPDHSIRICAFESDRPVTVYELRDEEEVLCAVCPTSELYLVAGISGVISVYTMSRRRRLVLSKHLYGHYEPVTCLAASSSYSIAISGSKDRTCIIWDLQNLSFIRQLRGHPVTVSAVGINDLTGDIATAAGTFLFYWDINGKLLTKLDIADGQAMHSDQILCVGFSQVNEWDPLNVIVTGGNDGCVRLWSEELVRVTQEEQSAELLSATSGDQEDDQVISIRRLSIHGSVSASAMTSRNSQLQSQDTDDLLSPNRDESPSTFDNDISQFLAKLEEQKLQQEEQTRQLAATTPAPSNPSIVIDPSTGSRGDIEWQRRLTLRKCINLQNLSAKKAKDNVGNVGGKFSVTAVAFSKDHKALHVGDSLGRVTTWLAASGW